MTDAELIEFIHIRLGGEKNTPMSRPLIIAMSRLALKDLAQLLLDTNSSMSKKLIATAVNQAWASSSFTAPTDMLFYKQKDTTRIDFGGTLAFQVEDRDKLDMSTGLGNTYYALEGKTFYIKDSAGATNGNNLNIRYYKVPAIADVDDELRPIFIELVLNRIIPAQVKPNEQS